MQVPAGWYRMLQVVAVVGLIAAAFEFGVLWEQRREKPDTVPAHRAGETEAAPPAQSINLRAEFNPQSALLIGANELVRYQQPVFVAIVKSVQDRLPVVGIVSDDEEVDLGRELLDAAGLPQQNVYFIKHPLDSMWIRDYGPMFARFSDGRVKIVDCRYDNPDEKGARRRDDEFPGYIGGVLNLEVDSLPLVIEGGNLLSNGDGLMVTSTRVIDRPENSRYTIQDIGALLQKHFGCRVWVYLRELEGEPTGHVDFCLTFLRRNLVVVGRYDPAYDPVNAAILDEMANTLAGQTTTMGTMVVERIPMPPRTAEDDWRSYCNILLVNGVVLMPSYKDVDPAIEKEARDTYARLLPSWTVTPIEADSLVKKRGVLHCVGIGVPSYVDVHALLGEGAD